MANLFTLSLSATYPEGRPTLHDFKAYFEQATGVRARRSSLKAVLKDAVLCQAMAALDDDPPPDLAYAQQFDSRCRRDWLILADALRTLISEHRAPIDIN